MFLLNLILFIHHNFNYLLQHMSIILLNYIKNIIYLCINNNYFYYSIIILIISIK